MKKDLIFTPVMLVVGILLFLLKTTGLTAHIAISVVGIMALAVYTVITKKDWKIPALEIVMRACYGIALATGIIVMMIEGVVALAILHKASAALFVITLIVLFSMKLISKGKSK